MTFVDQMGRSIALSTTPQRIISLVPSQTELLHYLGLGERVVGITKFCEHPADWFHSKTRIGGTKQFHFDRIHTLQPDLLLGNKEENDREQIERLAQDYPVWMSDIKTLQDALEMILAFGAMLDRKAPAAKLVADIQNEFLKLAQFTDTQTPLSAAYLIWKNPYMAAASDTFINHLLGLAGFTNCFADHTRYPQIKEQDLQNADPDCILLSSEPFPFSQKHLAELQKVCPRAVIKLVDGALFSWYGNRLLLAAPYFHNLRSSLEKTTGQ